MDNKRRRIWIVIAEEGDNYSILNTAFINKDRMRFALEVQKAKFPEAKYEPMQIELDEETLN